MAAMMSQLEDDKRSLEDENTRVAQENKDLFDQLEEMNTQVADSDAHIASLMATLSSAQFENKRLAALATKTMELEAQLTAMEIGQASLQVELATTKQDERSAVHRWKEAESRLRNLDDQVQQIERETRAERERHVQIVGQMERRRVVEKDLESAAGRLKGAAAANTIGRDQNGTNVVSHFVRDILQDNANLQAEILELRELLESSNDEVQNLRERVLEHQPILSDQVLEPMSLLKEFEQSRPKATSQEIHVHHHYHAKITAKEKGPNSRRPSRRRGPVFPSSISSTGCQTPLSRRGSTVMAMPRPGLKVNRWSTQSSATDFSVASSGPSSPYSDHRASSIFDRIDPGLESSRPTSPESAGFKPQFQLRPHSGSNITGLADVSEDEIPSTTLEPPNVEQHLGATPTLQIAISERRAPPLCLIEEAPQETSIHLTSTKLSAPDHGLDTIESVLPVSSQEQHHVDQPRLRRSESCESLVSISGMDIHLPQNRNRSRHLIPKPTSPSESPDHLKFSIAFPSAQPLASIAEINASSTNLASLSTSNCPNSVSLLSGLASGNLPQPGTRGLGYLVGSWVRGKWRIAPQASTVNPRSHGPDWSTRMPGINQKGPVLGFKPPARTPSEVNARMLDECLLKESLRE